MLSFHDSTIPHLETRLPHPASPQVETVVKELKEVVSPANSVAKVA